MKQTFNFKDRSPARNSNLKHVRTSSQEQSDCKGLVDRKDLATLEEDKRIEDEVKKRKRLSEDEEEEGVRRMKEKKMKIDVEIELKDPEKEDEGLKIEEEDENISHKRDTDPGDNKLK